MFMTESKKKALIIKYKIKRGEGYFPVSSTIQNCADKIMATRNAIRLRSIPA